MNAQTALVLSPSKEFHIQSLEPGFVQTLTISNSGLTRIAFKIKTSTPVYFGVKPNMGVLEPNNTIYIPGN